MLNTIVYLGLSQYLYRKYILYKMNLRIPVVYCFNDDFTLAAGVSIYSLLTNANPDNIYEIYILYGNN